MGGMTKLALGTTIAVALIFALFLTLFLLLLADFVSSLVRSRNRPPPNCNLNIESPNPKSPGNTFSMQQVSTTKPSTLPSFYAHGVLQAPTSFLLTEPKLEAAAAPPINAISSPFSVSDCSSSSGERFVCISNPVYDGVQVEEVDVEVEESTPFETPGTSPSNFGEEGEWSPPLGFMKKLPSLQPWHHHASVSTATDTNRASSYSFSSSNQCFSPSW